MNKLATVDAYHAGANYWAPLFTDDDNDDIEEVKTQNTCSNASETKQHGQQLIRQFIQSKFTKQKDKTTNRTIIVNSGATSHFVQAADDLPYRGKSQKTVHLPDGYTIKTSHTATLPFTTISDAAQEAHVLPGLKENLLLSVPTLATEGYTTIFHAGNVGNDIYDAKTVEITAKAKPVLQGWQASLGLWRMECCANADEDNRRNTESANNVYDLPSIPVAIRFLHAAVGYPTKATWLRAIKNGYYATWPTITTASVTVHFPKSIETIKGHTKKQRQNVRSTKVQLDQGTNNVDSPLSTPKQSMLVMVINAHPTLYSDQTGRFPVQSSRGTTQNTTHLHIIDKSGTRT